MDFAGQTVLAAWMAFALGYQTHFVAASRLVVRLENLASPFETKRARHRLAAPFELAVPVGIRR